MRVESNKSLQVVRVGRQPPEALGAQVLPEIGQIISMYLHILMKQKHGAEG